MPFLVVFNADDLCGFTGPEQSRLPGSVLEHARTAKVELAQVLNGWIRVPRQRLASAVDGSTQSDALGVSIYPPKVPRCRVGREPVPRADRKLRQGTT